MSDKRRYMALDLVSHEIQENLNQALTDLEGYLEVPEDTTRLRFTLAYIHQVAGSLTMIEYHGAALLAREIESLLAASEPENMDAGDYQAVVTTVQKAIEALKGHILEVIETGEEDPKSLLKPLNRIRKISRSGDEDFSHQDVFSAEVVHEPQPKQPPAINVREFQSVIHKIRQHFQRCLVGILKGEADEKSFAIVLKLTDALHKTSRQTASETFWDIARVFSDFLLVNQGPLRVEYKKSLRLIDSEFRRLETLGSKGLTEAPDQSALNGLLYAIAIAENPTQDMLAIREKYRLEKALDIRQSDVESIKSISSQYSHFITRQQDDLQVIKQSVSQYVSSDFDPGYLKGLPAAIHTLAERFNEKPFTELKPVCLALELILGYRVQSGERWTDVEQVADVISACEYFLECIEREEIKNLQGILARAHQQLLDLGLFYEEGCYSLSEDFKEAQKQEEQAEETSKAAPTGTVFSLPDDIDEEVFEIFIEEATEVLENLDILLPVIKEAPENTPTLQEIRRAWHTLKGSGRMVGASQMGDFAYALEHMLNQLISLEKPLGESGFHVLEEATSLLPALIHALREQQPIDLQALNQVRENASLIAEGKELLVSETAGVTEPGVSEMADEITAIDSDVDEEIKAVFLKESESLMAAFETFLGDSESTTEYQITSELHRTFHTLKGSSHMAGAREIAELVTPAERLIKDLFGFRKPANARVLALLEWTYEELSGMFSRLKASEDLQPNQTSALIQALRTCYAEHFGTDESTEDSQHQSLLQAAIDHLEVFQQLVDALTAGVVDEAAQQKAVVALATLAGIADERGVIVIRDFALAVSDSLKRTEPELLTAIESVMVIRDVQNALDDMLDVYAAHQEPQADDTLVMRLQSLGIEAQEAGEEKVVSSDTAEVTAEEKAGDEEFVSHTVAAFEKGSPAVNAVFIEALEQLLDQCEDWVENPEDTDYLPGIKHDLNEIKEQLAPEAAPQLMGLLVDLEKLLSSAELYHRFDAAFFWNLKEVQQSILRFLSDVPASVEAIEPSANREPSADREPSPDSVQVLSEETHLEVVSDKQVANLSLGGADVEDIIDIDQPIEDIPIEFDLTDDIQTTSIDTDSILEIQLEEGEDSEPVPSVDIEDPVFNENLIVLEEAEETSGQLSMEAIPVDVTVAGGREAIYASLPTASLHERIDWVKLSEEQQQAEEETLSFFVEEARDLISELEHAATAWIETPADLTACATVKRVLHTIKGGSRLTQLSVLGDLTHEFESMIELAEAQAQFDQAFFSRFSDYLDALLMAVGILLDGPAMAEVAENVSTASKEGDIKAPEAASESSDSSGIKGLDEDIVTLFIDEAADQMDILEECLSSLGANEDISKALEDAKRALHTLKGGARLAGITDMGNVSHDYESAIIQAERQDELNSPALLEQLQTYQELLANRLAEITTELSASEEDLVHMAAQADEAVASTLSQASIDATKNFFEQQGRQQQAKKGEPIKVAAEVIENLVNLAGESSIGRSRIEKQVNDVNFSVDDMSGTIERLHGQLRRLEIETEAQILFRQEQVVNEGQENFDPLEMDRYTHMQQLSKSLIESASDLDDLNDTLTDKIRDLETLLLQQTRLNTEMQEALMRAQMVPFSRMVPRLKRIVRQTARELSKQVRFSVINAEGEMDRTILESMIAPLEHMLRNAVDHGIETPEERLAKNKPAQGEITLTLLREGGEIILKLQDDGGGINLAAVRKKAEEQGLLNLKASISDHELSQFILHAGFSTARKVTQISGRGVGMDVVHSEIKQIGGSMDIDTSDGGSAFTVRLPFTVSMNRALMVCVGQDTYAIPLNNIEGIVRVSPYELENYYQEDAPPFDYAGQSYQMLYLGALLNLQQNVNMNRLSHSVPVVLIRSSDYSVAIQVDKLLGSQEVVVKSLGPQFSMVDGLSGATVLGDGSVVVILDMPSLIRADISRGFVAQAPDESLDVSEIKDNEESLSVMVVDDSVTVRKVTSRLLERMGLNVTLAKDGLDAINQLQDMDKLPDIMLLDIEMPRMDGFEVVSRVRHSERLTHIPICMITSRTGEKHRERALSLGANDYLGKPFQETALLETIERLTGYAVLQS